MRNSVSFMRLKILWKPQRKLNHINTLQNFMNAVTISNINLFIIMTPEAERFNGWAAMLGFVAAVGAYVTTGQIIPGWF